MAATTNEDTVLQLLTPLFLRDLGQTLEGDIFQALKQSPHVVRSLEFALADGAIDCSRARPTNMSYAERLMHIFSFEPDEEIMSEIVLFDVKSSSTDDEESHRVYKTVEGQRRRVGFWVCISAADPHWVDVIPNRHQDAEALAEFDPEEDLQGDRNDETINAWRDSRLHSAAHRFLDPCATPYRMPLVLLPLAIDLIRRCALGLGDFTNPWSGVTFRNWRPITTRRTEWLKPMESTAHYTSFEDAWEVFKGFRSCASMKFDLVGLQPSLADYKLCRTVDRRVLQTFVQAKGEGRIRGQQNKLDKVCAVRKGRYYFDVRDRHDFFHFTFEFSGNPPRRLAYFIPERAVPDHFYTSLDRHVDFTIEEFIPYRIEIDNGMRWVRRMEEIIEDTPLPRRCRDMLPPRPLPLEKDRVGDDESDEDEEEEGYRTSDEGEGAQHSQVNLHSTNLLPVNATRKRTIDRLEKKRATKKAKLAAKANKKAAKKTKKSKEQAEEKKHSRQQYRDVMVRGHRRFFYSVMAQCAIRGRGLLIELARNGRSGDFGFCRYRWTQSERAAFLQHSRVPAAVHDLAAATPLVCIFYYCRHRESWFTGPKIAPKHYERLDMLLQNSIIFWDISGPDVVIREEASETSTQNDTNERPILAIVPSEDVQPTQKQRSSIEASMRKPQDDWEKHTPSISSMLNTGRFLTEYCMPRTPLDAGCDWSAIWEFLDNLTTVSNFQYPAGHDRDSKTYRHTLQAVNQELAQYWDDLKQTGGHDDEADDVEVHASDVSDQDGS